MRSFVKMSKREGKQIKQFRSLTVTLATAFLALSAVVLFVASSLAMYCNFQNQRKLISSQLQSTAQRAASTVKSFMQEKFITLETAFNIGNLARTDHRGQKLVLEKLLGLEPAFRQLILLGEQGQELVKVSRLSKLASANLTERVSSELLSELSQGEKYISPVFIDAITSEPLVIMAVPVTDVFGDYKGILMAEVNLKFMWDLVDRIKVGKKGLAYVVDKQGNLIAFGDISRVLGGENLIHIQEVAEFVEGDKTTHKNTADISKGILNTRVVSNHAHLGMPEWAVVVELPVLEAYETVVNSLILSIVVVFFSFLLAIVAGIYLSKRITNPIITLRDATRRIGKGKLNTKIEVQSKDEIGELAVSFNQMINNLKRITVSRNSLKKEVKQRKLAEEALQKAYDELKASKEREIERSAQLEASNRELEAFSYSVSHDLRAPLRGIDGFSQALLEDYADQLDTQGKDYLRRVRAASQRLEHIIDDMLILSRVTRREMRRELVNLSTMAQEIAAEFQTSQSERPVSFIIAPGLVVKADPNLMRIALENLLDNAWKFTSKHETARIEVGVTVNDGEHAYYVRDDGAGFNMAYVGNLFGAFQRLHPISDFGGTGIGLATVQRIILRHGGRVWAEGVEEQGATFYFTLPK